MKQFYTLLTLIFTFNFTFSQTPIVTTIIDGPCSGGEPKVIEIYASGTVDFSNYALERRTNSNPWSSASNVSLDFLGTITDNYVYIIGTGDSPEFQGEYPAIAVGSIFENSIASGNGDDSFRIVTADLSTVVDEFGGEVDGSGEPWEYLDSWAKRNNGTGPDSNFTIANWSFGGPNALDGLGVCNSGTALSNSVKLGDFTLSTQNKNLELVKIGPNPTSTGFVTITNSTNQTLQVALYNALGQLVKNETLVNNRIDVSDLSTGLYLVKISSENNSTTKKLIIK